MCGRYYLDPSERFEDRFQLSNHLKSREARYNICPGQVAPIIVSDGSNKIKEMTWGLIPFWAKDAQLKTGIINAKAETITTKPSFKKAFASQRCLIPVSGFYEWQEVGDSKVPFLFKSRDANLFALAGIYDSNQDTSGHRHKTFAIITTTPGDTVAKIHDRSPLILSPADESIWLNPKTNLSILKQLLTTDSSNLNYYQVSTDLSRSFADSPHLIEPVKAS